VKSVQCDNGLEFDNSTARTFLHNHGITMHLSCPHTSPQNGWAKRIIHSTNDIMRSLMFQASLPVVYWVEALRTATYLLNLHPTKTLLFATPHFTLYGIHSDLFHPRVFGCKCYLNLSSMAAHKLAPRSTVCVFLGYPTEHKGYRCLDLATNRIIISCHVTFDESSFPFAEISDPPSSSFDFLSELDWTPFPIGTNPSAGTPKTAAPVGLVPQAAPSSTWPSHLMRPPHGFGVPDQHEELITPTATTLQCSGAAPCWPFDYIFCGPTAGLHSTTSTHASNTSC
jgi:hypothetical protein